eukprot:200516-Rhodomonas_salina.2
MQHILVARVHLIAAGHRLRSGRGTADAKDLRCGGAGRDHELEVAFKGVCACFLDAHHVCPSTLWESNGIG